MQRVFGPVRDHDLLGCVGQPVDGFILFGNGRAQLGDATGHGVVGVAGFHRRADVALLILDAQEGVNALDTHIGGYAHESRRSVIIVVNKWDAIKKGPTTTEDFTAEIRDRMKYLDYAPIVFISALRGQRLGSLLKAIAQSR